ncbi:hypothetical protein PTTG_29922, partial [Puccinia triticina 1-1 BBBD Race 1]
SIFLLPWMCTWVSSAFLASSNFAISPVHFLPPSVDAAKSSSSRSASRINSYPLRGGVTLETKQLAPVIEVEGDIHCPLTSDCMENQKEILSLMRKFENCHGLVLLEKLQDLAILQTSLKPEDAYNFKVAVQALFLTALSNKSQQKEIFQFFLEASGPFFGTLKGADKFGPWEENLVVNWRAMHAHLLQMLQLC